MPIKDKSIYPPYWDQFSLWVRTDRSGGKCERCEVPNGWMRVTYKNGFDGVRDFIGPTIDGLIFSGDKVVSRTRIVLTVAHLDYDGGPCRCKAETGRKCARPDHVEALCQRCHLAIDRPKHIENRRRNLMEQRDQERRLLSE